MPPPGARFVYDCTPNPAGNVIFNFTEGTRPLLQTKHPFQRHTIERAFTAQFAVKKERNGVPHPTVDWLLFPFRQNANTNGRSEPE